MRVLVHCGNKPGQAAAGVLLGGHPVRGLRHTDRMDVGHVLPLERPVRGTVRHERGWFRDDAVRAGVADVAQGPGPGQGGGPRGQMVRPEERRCSYVLDAAATVVRRRRRTVLVIVPDARRVEAHPCHVRVPVPAAVERRVRDTVLLGGRVP